MKNNIKNIKQKSVIQELRAIRDKVSLEIKDMNPKQLKEYLNKKKTLHPKSVWQKVG
jgi:hypothetical protein